MEEIIRILNSVKPGVDFSSSQDFIKEELLNSLEIVILVGKLNDAFDIEIGAADLRPENFKNLDSLQKLIEKLEEE